MGGGKGLGGQTKLHAICVGSDVKLPFGMVYAHKTELLYY